MANSSIQPQSSEVDISWAKGQRERTFIMMKPDGVQRNITGKTIAKFEQRGFRLIAMKMIKPSEEHMRVHYDELKNFSFFDNFMKFATSGPVVAMIWEGDNVITTGRHLIGSTKPADHKMGTTRADYSIGLPKNCVHGSDSAEAALREITHWFKPEDVVHWDRHDGKWIYEKDLYE